MNYHIVEMVVVRKKKITIMMTSMVTAFIGYILCTRLFVRMLSRQSCRTLRDPMDCSVPDSSARGILQARALEWVAMPSSRPGSLHCVYSML